MSNVANQKLCEELYELSGWTIPEKQPHWSNTVSSNVEPHYELWPEKHCSADIPAYTLGYLLRKLEDVGFVDGPSVGVHLRYDFVPHTGYKWIAYFPGYGYKYGGVEDILADTPEDAVAKLCIELIKQGILKPETTPTGGDQGREYDNVRRQ